MRREDEPAERFQLERSFVLSSAEDGSSGLRAKEWLLDTMWINESDSSKRVRLDSQHSSDSLSIAALDHNYIFALHLPHLL